MRGNHAVPIAQMFYSTSPRKARHVPSTTVKCSVPNTTLNCQDRAVGFWCSKGGSFVFYECSHYTGSQNRGRVLMRGDHAVPIAQMIYSTSPRKARHGMDQVLMR
jgi:hypothetical protein